MARVIHLIGNAHLDPIWQWTWQEGYAEIKATYRSALDRIRQFDDFVFTCAGASNYQWVEENCPEMFEEIRQRVREGRWVIAGGWWLQPDCNMPSGESLARHSLYGQRYFLEKFGVTAKTGYNVDSFGHNAMIPQILRKSGMENYVFMRPFQSERALPGDLFWWEAPDKSRVLAFRLPVSYCTRDNTAEGLRRHLEACYAEVADMQDVDMMVFYGVGNHGGGPTIRTIDILHGLQQTFDKAELTFSSPDRYFASIREQKPDLPVVTGDFQHHACGCFSALSAVKKQHRAAENRLLCAERLSVLASSLTGLPYPGNTLRAAWQDVLFCQFHDVLCGCAVKAAYDDVFHFLGEAQAVAARAANSAAQKISWAIDTVEGRGFPLSKDSDWAVWEQEELGTPLVVFNLNGFDQRSYVRVNKALTSVKDEEGREVPVQRTRSACSNCDPSIFRDGTFLAEVPALGYRVYRVFLQREPEEQLDGPAILTGEGRMENPWWVLELDPREGGIRSLWDKENGREVFDGPAAGALVIADSDTTTWSHRKYVFDEELGRFSGARLTVLENGPLTATVRAESRYGDSMLTQDFTIYRDTPAVEVKVRLDWREKDTMLKLDFPARLEDPKAVYEIPFGYLEKPADGLEEPALQWAAVTDGRYTLGIATDAKYSFSVAGNRLRFVAVRSPMYCYQGDYRDDLCERMDLGVQEFSYMILPQKGFRAAELTRRAAAFNNPLCTVMETFHTGSLPLRYRGLSVDRENIALTACKPAEDGDGLILRFYETDGRETEAVIDVPAACAHIRAVFTPFEIKTFYMDAQGNARETDLLEFSCEKEEDTGCCRESGF